MATATYAMSAPDYLNPYFANKNGLTAPLETYALQHKKLEMKMEENKYKNTLANKI